MSDGVSLSISQSEMKKFKSQMDKHVQINAAILRQVLTKTGYNIQSTAKKILSDNKGRVTSALFNSITIEVKDSSVIVGTGKEYGINYEFGTKSKKIIPPELIGFTASSKDVPFDQLYQAIKLWVKRKGLDSKATWPIARSIAKHGQAAHPFLYPAFKKEKARFEQVIKQAMR